MAWKKGIVNWSNYMRFKIIGEHRGFYNQNGYLELESVLTSEEISLLSTAADKLLEKRLVDQFEFHSAEELFKAGRDLWREDTIIRKRVLSHNLAELGADLFRKKSILLAYDQLLRTGAKPGFPQKLPLTLNEMSSIVPLAGALLLHLSGPQIPSEFIPRQPENVVFLSPDMIIPWELFFQLPHQSYLLIAYAAPESVYVLQKKDPHTHALKKLGYVFGDRLKHEHHPLLYQKN